MLDIFVGDGDSRSRTIVVAVVTCWEAIEGSREDVDALDNVCAVFARGFVTLANCSIEL